MKTILEYIDKSEFKEAAQELKKLINQKELIDAAQEFAGDYDWDNEDEYIDGKEACQDAYIEGVRFAMNYLQNKK